VDEHVNRVRVARVIARMNVGGPAQQIARLVEGLDPARYEQVLWCGEVEGDEADFIQLRAPDLPHRRLETMRRSVGPTADLAALRTLVEEFRRFRPHIVHTHTAKAGVLGRIAARIAGVPLQVHTFHGHLLNSYWDPRVTRAVIEVERTLARRTDLIMAVGTRVRDDLVSAGIGRPDRYMVVPPGVAIDPPGPGAAARARFDIPPDAFTVAFVGRMAAVKRPDRMLEAARRLVVAVPGAMVLVAGEGPLYAQTRAGAGDLGDSVRFLGWQSEIQQVYAAADIALLTSDNEGMPVGLIEASLCGIPCVTTDAGSAGEVVLDGITGRVVPREAAAVASALIDLAADPRLRAAMGEAARVHAEASFGAARLVADVDRSYRRLLEGSGLLRTGAALSAGGQPICREAGGAGESGGGTVGCRARRG
jgi:glycosyltransferase involved in cell wall biosynthesis